MIDLHTHILPGIDDGPKDWDESMALARALSEAGVRAVAATSHIKPPIWPNRAETMAPLRAELSRRLSDEGIELGLYAGAEHWWCGTVLDALGDGGGLPYDEGRSFLVEIHPGDDPPMFEERIYALQRQGLRPVLAHVERYSIFSGRRGLKRLQTLVHRGVAAQINLASLGRGLGWARGGNAKRFLMAGLVSVVCGDCHRAGDVAAAYGRGLAALRKLGGEGAVKRLLVTNPERILAGREVDPWAPV